MGRELNKKWPEIKDELEHLHYSITNFCRKNGGNAVLASKFARHTNLQTTMVYIHTEKEELYESIEKAHDTKILERVRNMQNNL